MIKYGLKLWTTDKNLFGEAADLLRAGLVDLVELYIVPDFLSMDGLKIFKGTNAIIHAPHYGHGFNIFTFDKKDEKMFKKQVIGAADFLAAEHIIVHAGIGTDEGLFKKNIEKIHDSRILIENKPKFGPKGELLFGYSLRQLEFIKRECGLEICLDIAHAIKSAFSQGMDYKEYLELLLNGLDPSYFHISDGTADNEIDDHLDLGAGNFDLAWLAEKIKKIGLSKDISLIFEIPKKNGGLKKDLINMTLFKNLAVDLKNNEI